MAEGWESSKIKYSDDEIRIGHFTNHHMGKYFKEPGLGRKMAANFNLYNFILHNLDKSNTYLAKAITNEGKRIFTEKEVGNIKTKIGSQRQMPYAKKLLGVAVGGGPAVAGPAVGGPAVAGHAVAGPAKVTDESRNGFWDKMFLKITSPITSRIDPNGWANYFIWWTQILYQLEQMDLYGPFISQALDTVTLSLPVLAEITSELAGKMISLAPVPYASFAGDAIGYAVSLMFVLTAVVINNSRRHFGAAFKTSLDAVPVIGESLSIAAINFETGADRYGMYKKKLMKSVGKISPTASDIIYSYAPDVEKHEEKLPPLDVGKIGDDFEDYAKKASGLDKVEEMAAKVGNVGALTAAAGNAAAASASNAVDAAKASASNAVDAAKASASNAVGSASSSATNALTAVATKKGGGRRTRRRRRR